MPDYNLEINRDYCRLLAIIKYASENGLITPKQCSNGRNCEFLLSNTNNLNKNFNDIYFDLNMYHNIPLNPNEYKDPCAILIKKMGQNDKTVHFNFPPNARVTQQFHVTVREDVYGIASNHEFYMHTRQDIINDCKLLLISKELGENYTNSIKGNNIYLDKIKTDYSFQVQNPSRQIKEILEGLQKFINSITIYDYSTGKNLNDLTEEIFYDLNAIPKNENRGIEIKKYCYDEIHNKVKDVITPHVNQLIYKSEEQKVLLKTLMIAEALDKKYLPDGILPHQITADHLVIIKNIIDIEEYLPVDIEPKNATSGDIEAARILKDKYMEDAVRLRKRNFLEKEETSRVYIDKALELERCKNESQEDVFERDRSQDLYDLISSQSKCIFKDYVDFDEIFTSDEEGKILKLEKFVNLADEFQESYSNIKESYDKLRLLDELNDISNLNDKYMEIKESLEKSAGVAATSAAAAILVEEKLAKEKKIDDLYEECMQLKCTGPKKGKTCLKNTNCVCANDVCVVNRELLSGGSLIYKINYANI